MPRFQMDDSIYDDPAVIRAGTAAFGLYSRCGAYVARQLLDGFVPSEIAAQYGTPEWVRKLTGAGLWKTVPGGYLMPRYLADNQSRDKVLATRKLKAERQQRWLDKQRSGTSGRRRVSRRSSGASNDASIDGPEDAALPPSLTGRKGDARASTANAARASPKPTPAPPPSAEVLARNHGRPASDEARHAYAARARQAITRQEAPHDP